MSTVDQPGQPGISPAVNDFAGTDFIVRVDEMTVGEDNSTMVATTNTKRGRRALRPLVIAAIFLAPVNIVAGMTAGHGDSWKLVFLGSFLTWLLLVSAALIYDLWILDQAALIRRCLWHILGCITMLYFFMSILHLDTDNLPQWIPLIMDLGLGASHGLQNIPPDSRKNIWAYLANIADSVYGGTRILINRDRQSRLPPEERIELRSQSRHDG